MHMKLSTKQQADLASIKYFTPSWCDFAPIADEDIETFFAWSDKGIPYTVNEDNKLSGLAALHYGKQYREVHIAMYKEDINNGKNAKWQILNDMPEDARGWMQNSLKGVGPGKGVYKLWKGLYEGSSNLADNST